MDLQTIFKDSKGRWRDDVLWKIVPYTWRSERKWRLDVVSGLYELDTVIFR